MSAQLAWFLGMVTCICGALIGQADLIPDGTWKHAITIAFVVGTAASGFMLQRPVPKGPTE